MEGEREGGRERWGRDKEREGERKKGMGEFEGRIVSSMIDLSDR